MATIKDFKIEIAKLAKKQKECKLSGSQWEQYMNRGVLHAMYTAYYILKHNLSTDEYVLYLTEATEAATKTFWANGWRGYSNFDAQYKFRDMVNDFHTKYGEVICADKQEA